MQRHHFVLLYILPAIILTVILSPLLFMMLMMSPMITDSGSTASVMMMFAVWGYIFGIVASSVFALISYLQKKYSAAIACSAIFYILLAPGFYFYFHDPLYTLFLFYLSVCILILGYLLYSRMKK